MKKRWMSLLALAVMAAGCTDGPEPLSVDAAEPKLNVWGTDADYDGIDDGTEWELANRHAPLLYMPNLISRGEAGAGVAGDWTWPASVEWYTANTRLRFHHDNCSDHQILGLGYVTPANLTAQRHQRATSWWGCSHSGTVYYSNGGGGWSSENHFFLQAVYDDVTHPGQRDPSQWKTYVHAYRNSIGGINLQYWFFYAYNDFISTANHEGDWEHVTVRLDAAHNVVGLWYGQHTGEAFYQPYEVTWYGTHPQVWVADGSHASYPSEPSCDYIASEGYDNSCWTNVNQRWFTWSGGQGGDAGLQGAGLVNLGESAYPMQSWIKYSGRWGELGNTSPTSGPRSPVYQASWSTDAYSSGGTGTGGGSDGEDCTPTNADLQAPC